MENTSEKVSKVIRDFLENVASVGGVYVASLDGLLVAHASRIDVDPDRVAAMIASISAVGDRVSKELLNEESTHVIVQASAGYIIVRRQGDLVFGILVRSVDESTMGLVMIEFDRLLEAVRSVK